MMSKTYEHRLARDLAQSKQHAMGIDPLKLHRLLLLPLFQVAVHGRDGMAVEHAKAMRLARRAA